MTSLRPHEIKASAPIRQCARSGLPVLLANPKTATLVMCDGVPDFVDSGAVKDVLLRAAVATAIAKRLMRYCSGWHTVGLPNCSAKYDMDNLQSKSEFSGECVIGAFVCLTGGSFVGRKGGPKLVGYCTTLVGSVIVYQMVEYCPG